MAHNTGDLIAENAKLKKALEGLICWVGQQPEGPPWATDKAKTRNRQMFERAIEAACECFPENYNGFLEQLSAN